MGKVLVRLIQASLKQNTVRVSYGPDVLARHLTFGSATPYMAVSPGTRTVQFAAPGEHTAMTVELHPDSVYTIVVLDSSSGLKVDALTDAVGSEMMPMGGSALALAAAGDRDRDAADRHGPPRAAPVTPRRRGPNEAAPGRAWWAQARPGPSPTDPGLGKPSGILERTNPGRPRPGLGARPGMSAARTRFPCPDGRRRDAA